MLLHEQAPSVSEQIRRELKRVARQAVLVALTDALAEKNKAGCLASNIRLIRVNLASLWFSYDSCGKPCSRPLSLKFASSTFYLFEIDTCN